MGPPFAGGRSSIAARLTGGPGPGGGLKKPWSMALPYYHGGCREFIIGTIERGVDKNMHGGLDYSNILRQKPENGTRNSSKPHL